MMQHQYVEGLGYEQLGGHLVFAHHVPIADVYNWPSEERPTLTALQARHRLEHNWPHIAPGLAPRPQDVDPISEAEYRALWGDR